MWALGSRRATGGLVCG
ncbi:hypothetical protein E2C01_089003 [Portunus trituberculatus]|uniref:Uncharacterized protein n=1 Tax=Portunus trituberculatus TaxID=210409 RepID=A0A5B7JLC7_PORTR|nr:hypothetical protein [Portunus trituberculatus]